MAAIERIRVLLADDHAILRQGLSAILRSSQELEVVGEAADGFEAVERALELLPDVVVLDISMPRLNGIEAARRIKRALPKVRVLVLTMHDEEEYLVRMVRAGVSGYIVKDGAASQLMEAIRVVSAGGEAFAPKAARALAEIRASGQPLPEEPLGNLTDREREIFHLLVAGSSNASVAEALCISPKTVDNHRTHIMEKLGVHSSPELVRFAARHRLL